MPADAVDIRDKYQKKCHSSCLKQWAEYQACAKRIEKFPPGEKVCNGTYNEYIKCVDDCAAPQIFHHLK